MNFNEIYSEIIQNRENHQQGYFNCIPFMGMERLERYLPGIEESSYYLLGANSGVGKSKLCRFLFIHNPLIYLENNPDIDIKFDVLYFSLEESKEKIVKGEICKYLFTKYGLDISIKQLSSVGRYNTITEDILEKVKEAEEHVNKFLSKIKIFDSIRNPSGIYKTVRDFALSVGTYYDINNKPLSNQELNNIKNSIGEDYKKVSYYKKHHPRHYVIVMVDHLSLIQPELGETLWQSMGKMSSKYCLHFRDKFKFTPVVVQQFSADKNKIENCCAILKYCVYLHIYTNRWNKTL